MKRLVASGHEVRALLRHPPSEPEQGNVTVIPGALDDTDALTRLITNSDAVVHAAGLTRACSAAEFDRVNVTATRRLAALCAAADIPPFFLLLSSLAARSPELSDYADSKRRAEAAVAAQDRLGWAVLRPPAVYGPGDTATLPIFHMMSRGWLLVPPDVGARVSLIYVEDLCAAIETVLTGSIGRGAVLEVRDACGRGYDWAQFAEAGGKCLERRVRRLPIPKPVLLCAGYIAAAKCLVGGAPPRVSPGKVRELCHIDWVCRDNPIADASGWAPEVGIEEGFRRTFGWYRSQNWL